jgi:hypothetical protein
MPRRKKGRPAVDNLPIKTDSDTVKEMIAKETQRLNSTYMKINGEKISLRQWKLFESYIKNAGDLSKILEETGYSQSSYYQIKNTKKWWAELVKQHIEPWQDKLYIGMAEQTGLMLSAFKMILKGEFPESKQAMAAAQMIKQFTSMGFKRGDTIAAPLLHNSRDLWGDGEEEKKEKDVINIQIVQQVMVEMNREEANEWAMTGELPLRLAEKAKLLDKQRREEEEQIEEPLTVDYEDLP